MNKLSVLAGLTLCAGIASANVLYSYDTDLQGWKRPSWGGAALTLDHSTDTGSGAMKIHQWGPSGNDFCWIGVDDNTLAAKIKGKTKLLIDMTVLDPTGWNWSNGKAVFQGDGLGWSETAQMNYPSKPGSMTIEFDISGITSKLTNFSPSWFQMYLGVNGDGAVAKTLYVDNIRAVPEPATMAVLALGAGMLVRRRKK